MEFVEVSNSIDIPRAAGVKGLVKTIEAVLHEIPRVKSLSVNTAGKLTYVWYAPKDVVGDNPTDMLEDKLSLGELTPYAVLRGKPILEVLPKCTGLAVFVELFHAMNVDRLYPICLVVGTMSLLPAWARHYGLDDSYTRLFESAVVSDARLFGVPIVSDRHIPDEVIILCASYARTEDVEDTYRAYKLVLEVPLNA
jgi:hypothetical protein